MGKSKKRKKTPRKKDPLEQVASLLQTLQQDEESSDAPVTRLGLIAKSVLSLPTSLDELEATIAARPNRLPYPYPAEREPTRRTFVEWLKVKGADEVLLSDGVLGAVGRALKLVEIARLDFQFEKEKLSGHGFPLKFHRTASNEIERHADRMAELRQKYNVPENWSGDYEVQIGRQQIKELLAISSYKWPGDRKKIMGTGWAFDRLAALLVYWVLRAQLGTRLSNRCLRMLAQIIASKNDLPVISPDALRMDLARRE